MAGQVLGGFQGAQDQGPYGLAYGGGERGRQSVARAAGDEHMEAGVQIVEAAHPDARLRHARHQLRRLVEILGRCVAGGGLEAGPLQDHPGLQNVLEAVAAEGEVETEQPAQGVVRVAHDAGPGVGSPAGLGHQDPDGLQHPERLAQGGAADAEHRSQFPFGRQPVTGAELSGEDPFLDAAEHELMGAGLPHGLPFDGHPSLPVSAGSGHAAYVTPGMWSDLRAGGPISEQVVRSRSRWSEMGAADRPRSG